MSVNEAPRRDSSGDFDLSEGDADEVPTYVHETTWYEMNPSGRMFLLGGGEIAPGCRES